jgi:RNA recognition motif-containing protein
VNIFIGNLSPDVTEQDLRLEFLVFGEVMSVVVMSDRNSGKGQTIGYGFVEMASKSEGGTAVARLKGKYLRGIPIDVIEALPLTNKNLVSAKHRTKAIRDL